MEFMCGIDDHQDDMFSYVSAEERVCKDHPLRMVRAMTAEISSMHVGAV